MIVSTHGTGCHNYVRLKKNASLPLQQTLTMSTTTAPLSSPIVAGFLNGNKIDQPLVIKPKTESNNSVETLETWIRQNHENVSEKIQEHGAILFRNFQLNSPLDFEKIAKAIDSNLRNEYLGTSPRMPEQGTTYIFSASELPDFYPIPQHCEMSYMQTPPRKLFFWCGTTPREGGETPICDFRKVYAQMDPSIRDQFESKGIRNIRNYEGPNGGSKFDLWKLKRWDEMFLSTDKKEVEAHCKHNQIEYHWKENNKLKLVDNYDSVIKHPVTGEKVWFNHCNFRNSPVNKNIE